MVQRLRKGSNIVNWRLAAPLITTVVMLAAAWGGIAQENQNESLSALLWGISTILLGVLMVEIIVAWWIDVHRKDEPKDANGSIEQRDGV